MTESAVLHCDCSQAGALRGVASGLVAPVPVLAVGLSRGLSRGLSCGLSLALVLVALATAVDAAAAPRSRRSRRTVSPAAAQAQVERAKQQAEAAALSRVAFDKADQGDFETAAAVYHDAARTDPSDPSYLYGAARAEHLGAGAASDPVRRRALLEQAAADYQAYLQLASGDADQRGRAAAHLKDANSALAAFARPPPPAAAPVSRPPVVRVVAESSWRRTAGWSALATGAVALGLGAVALLRARSDETDLQARLDQRNGAGYVTGINFADASDASASVRRTRLGGYAACGVGLAAVGTGAWWLLSGASEDGARPAVAAAVGGRSAALVLAF